jgi:hypothetical protein
VDSVCIGLTSSNRVTFAENATAFVLSVAIDAQWPGLQPPAPFTCLHLGRVALRSALE